MISAACLTTSWDDGHPLDLRVADLLAKHGIAGTFYIPRSSEFGTMTPAQIRNMARDFEIGAHTVGHLELPGLPDREAEYEIAASKSWLEDTLGTPCALFCPPRGHYRPRHVEMVRRAGYLGLRSTELASLDHPRRSGGIWLMPTTVQVFPRDRVLDYIRNSIKRAAVANLWRFVLHGRSGEWPALARALLHRTVVRGGVFHLWGHSWELAGTSQWERLESVLRLMAETRRHASALTNGEICRRAQARPQPPIAAGTAPVVGLGGAER
jgi:peptidoglycan-N-acetylglucosamine deacetylase